MQYESNSVAIICDMIFANQKHFMLSPLGFRNWNICKTTQQCSLYMSYKLNEVRRSGNDLKVHEHIQVRGYMHMKWG